jgi:hypothetical protein
MEMYEAHKWKIGEEITSEKLNHIEKGIEEAGGDIQTNITDPQDGQTLKYDAASGKWVNAEGGGSSTLVVHTTTGSDDAVVMDKTWQEIYNAMPNVMEESEDDSFQLRQPVLYAMKSSDTQYDIVVGDFDIRQSAPTATFTRYRADSASGNPIWIPQD